jgi:hypothetical protein
MMLPLSTAACCLLSAAAAAVAVVAAVRVFKQLTVSYQQLILLKLCMLVCARVFGCVSES